MVEYTVVTSLCSDKVMTQAGIVYLCTAINENKQSYKILDLSGILDYSNTPKELNTKCNSNTWLNPDSIRNGDWMDDYLPSLNGLDGNLLFSSLYSPDVIFHARLSYNIKKINPDVITVIGGCAVTQLQKEQLDVLSIYFDYILIGHDVKALLKAINNYSNADIQCEIITKIEPPSFRPDYSLMPLNELVTVYSGHGCYYGKCNFCDYPSRAYQKTLYRAANEVAHDVYSIYQLQPKIKDIVLTQDSYTEKYLKETTLNIGQYGGKIPYNLMLRADPWISEETGEYLAKTGCTDVFIGAEALDEDILAILNKGIVVDNIINAVKVLAKYIKVTIGMILFVPGIHEKSLNTQMNNIEKILPYIHKIEPEILTVVHGSEFAKNPTKYGVKLYEANHPINNSWCYGMSHDIPWSMVDSNMMKQWFGFSEQLKGLCSNHVKQGYWRALDNLRNSSI